jgi:hypothetical protein
MMIFSDTCIQTDEEAMLFIDESNDPAAETLKLMYRVFRGRGESVLDALAATYEKDIAIQRAATAKREVKG